MGMGSRLDLRVGIVTLLAERTLPIAGGSYFAAYAAEQRTECWDACDDDAEVNLDDRPFDDSLRLGVSGEVGYGLDADRLYDCHEESEAVEEDESDLRWSLVFGSSMVWVGACQTDFAASIEI